MNFLTTLIYGAKYIYKTGAGLAAPWLAPVGRKAVLWGVLALTVMVVPWVLKQSGRRAVTAEVSREATELHQKDGAENLELVREMERMVSELEEAARRHKEQQERALSDEYKEDARGWAIEPLPRSVIERLRGRQD